MIFSSEALPEEAKKILEKWEIAEGDASHVGDANVFMVWKIDPETIRKAKRLKAIQTFSAGVDHLPFEYIPRSVKIFSNAGAYSKPVAEHAWALILSLAKGINIRDKKVAANYPRQLFGKTMLVLGSGGIGQETAKVAKCFGMKTIGYSRHQIIKEGFDEIIGPDQLLSKLPNTDVIVIALPLNKYTKNLLNASNISLLKDECIIVNVGRGDVINQDAIYDALKSRPGLRFGTDVWWKQDNIEGSRLDFYGLPNFAGTPHVASGALKEISDIAKIYAAKNVALFLETGKANNEVNFDDYVRTRPNTQRYD